jgi:hypothetical protein
VTAANRPHRVGIPGSRKRSKVIKHEAIHLLLLVDSLWEDYTRGWITNFAAAFDKFREEAALGKKTRHDPQPSEYWVRYGQWTRVNSDRAENILVRHQFFVEKMYDWLQPKLKDQQRIFGALERELIYYRDKKRCQECDAEVAWSDHEIHHVEEHSQGGKSILDNGALVHKHCHPKGAKRSAEFAEKWKNKRQASGAS